jgi:capsule polysaccharide export protein KpsC/LpsZ
VQGKAGYVLVAGQVPDDSSHYLTASDLREWAARAVADVREQIPGAEVVWRPHPVTRHAKEMHSIRGAGRVQMPQDVPASEALREARLLVTYSSTLGFEALLAGCPVVCYGETFYRHLAFGPDEMRSAKAPSTKDCESLLERVAYTQWSIDEMSSGEAFAFAIGEAKRLQLAEAA